MNEISFAITRQLCTGTDLILEAERLQKRRRGSKVRVLKGCLNIKLVRDS